MKHIALNFLRIFTLLALTAAQAQEPATELERVDALVAAGQLDELAALYDRVLAAEPDNRRALLGRASVHSWEGQRREARAIFEQWLAGHPDDIEALNGLGYDYAWGGAHRDAIATFERVLELDATNVGAMKGIAFAHLWSGDAQQAETEFRAAALAHPQDAEAQRGIGNALMAQRRGSAAEAAFENALLIDSTDLAAREGINAARQVTGPLEAAVWFGNSAAGGDVDVRALQLTRFIGQRSSMRLRFDDSLSLDNPSLARSGAQARATFVSGTHEFSNRWLGTVELGKRDLPEDFDQDIYKVEAALRGNQRTWKFGYQTSPHSAGFDDSLLFGGFSFPIRERLNLDATLFLAETGATGDDEYRAALYLEGRTARGWTLGGGFGFGDISSDIAQASGSVTTANLMAGIPVTPTFSTYFQLRWEDAPLDQFTVATIGIVVRPRRR